MIRKANLFATLGLALCCASSQAADYSYTVPTSVPEGSFFFENFLVRFSKNAALLTDNQVKIRPIGAGVIVPPLQVYESVQNGVLQAGHSTPTYLANQDPLNNVFASFPGGMSGEETLAWLYEGNGLQALQAFREKEMGLHSMVVGVGSSEILAHSNKKITSLEDFKGLKYRTAGAWAEVIKQVGAAPTVVPPGEIYTLLQRKGVDAIEWATPGANLSEGFHEVAPFILTPGVHQPSFVWEFFMKVETWNAMDKATQQKLEAAAKLTTMQGYLHFLDADMKAMQAYKKAGVEIVQLDKAVIEQLAKMGQQLMAEKIKQRPAGATDAQAILDDYNGYLQRWSQNSSYLYRH
ncbi:TRAP transporter substrate-binding protein DctP [Pseudomonas sp. CC6-YY-74]|uniref:TRAP transporter substrate-binding protein DctP n=1 Tax=Pseudomonas sp. CC6-YY-74 TaxID=1930532 RepID=UPI0009A22336|nr:TRAP transporter substrate-binding protein DctP [Pseudomonas sp. CC6-YY-74]